MLLDAFVLGVVFGGLSVSVVLGFAWQLDRRVADEQWEQEQARRPRPPDHWRGHPR